MLLKSCATPPASVPMASSFCDSTSRRSTLRASVTSRTIDTMQRSPRTTSTLNETSTSRTVPSFRRSWSRQPMTTPLRLTASSTPARDSATAQTPRSAARRPTISSRWEPSMAGKPSLIWRMMSSERRVSVAASGMTSKRSWKRASLSRARASCALSTANASAARSTAKSPASSRYQLTRVFPEEPQPTKGRAARVQRRSGRLTKASTGVSWRIAEEPVSACPSPSKRVRARLSVRSSRDSARRGARSSTAATTARIRPCGSRAAIRPTSPRPPWPSSSGPDSTSVCEARARW